MTMHHARRALAYLATLSGAISFLANMGVLIETIWQYGLSEALSSISPLALTGISTVFGIIFGTLAVLIDTDSPDPLSVRLGAIGIALSLTPLLIALA